MTDNLQSLSTEKLALKLINRQKENKLESLSKFTQEELENLITYLALDYFEIKERLDLLKKAMNVVLPYIRSPFKRIVGDKSEYVIIYEQSESSKQVQKNDVINYLIDEIQKVEQTKGQPLPDVQKILDNVNNDFTSYTEPKWKLKLNKRK